MKKAFTLIEVMVAMVILAVGVTGSMALFTHTIRNNQESKDIFDATVLAERTVNRIEAEARAWDKNVTSPNMLQGNYIRQVLTTTTLRTWQLLDSQKVVQIQNDDDSQRTFCIYYYVGTTPGLSNGHYASGLIRVLWRRDRQPCSSLSVNNMKTPEDFADIGTVTVPYALFRL